MLRATIFIVALMVGLVTSALADSRISGTVVDTDGKPVNGVTVRLTRMGDASWTHTAEVKKKGRFFFARIEAGGYDIDLVDSEFYVSLVTFKIRRGDGLIVSQGELEGHPRKGASGLGVNGVDEFQLSVVVEPGGEIETPAGDMVVESPELAEAVKLYNKGKYEESIGAVESALVEIPDSGEAFYLKGLALDKLGRNAESEQALLKATERIPDFPRIWGTLGVVSLNVAEGHDEAGQADEAKQAFGRAAEALSEAAARDPESRALRVNLTVALDRIGDQERLVSVLEEILELDPEHLQSRLRLAAAYSATGANDRAMELLDSVPATEKRVAVTLFNIAVDLNNKNDLEASLAAARRASEIDPELPQPRQLIAQNLLALGDHEAAIEAIRVFLELAPDAPEAGSYRAILEQLENKQ